MSCLLNNPSAEGDAPLYCDEELERLKKRCGAAERRVRELEGAPGNHELLMNEFTRLTVTHQEQKMTIRQLEAERDNFKSSCLSIIESNRKLDAELQTARQVLETVLENGQLADHPHTEKDLTRVAQCPVCHAQRRLSMQVRAYLEQTGATVEQSET